ncbi:MAG TPA: amidase [Acidimicrobiia bacterium]|nr:amidase [Acidimicrobiia bacterium]
MEPTSDDELLWLPAWRIAQEIAAKRVSPVEVTELALGRIDRLDGTLHAFLTVTPEVARAQARAAEVAVMRGDDLGPLHGVPVSIKDCLWTKGVRTTCGSLHFEDFVPAEDSVVAERLHAAGTVLVGKTNTPEFCAFGRTVNRLQPECVNPWDPTRIPGASSGGAAASVAAGSTPIAVGTDGGGSVRLPAALCGVVGLLPSLGRVPGYGTIAETPASRAGPISRDVRDNALMLEVIAGADPRESRSIPGPAPAFAHSLDAGIEGLRMAWTPDFGHLPVHEPAVIEAAARTAFALAGAGARVEELGSALDDARWLIVVLEQTDEFVALLRSFFDDPEKAALLSGFFFDPSNTGASPEATPHRDDELARARAEAERIRRNFSACFERYDVLLSPTFGRVAPKIPPGWQWPVPMDEWIAYTYLTNMTGTPSVSVPCGDVSGLPVGLQVMGRFGDEATILRVAAALEELQPWSGRRPPPLPSVEVEDSG